MDFLNRSPQANDFDYRRKKAFQSIANGNLTNLMLLLDGLSDDVTHKLLVSRSERPITLRRPSTAGNFRIQNPTLLASACAEWYMEIVEYLSGQKHGLTETVTVQDESNDIVEYSQVSPLCIATITGKFKMVQILLEHGADMNQQNSIGNTPLYEACFEGHITIVNHLIQRGANIELTNHKKVTCLMIASYNNNYEIVKLLTSLNADVNKKDRNDRNALFYCIASGSVGIFKHLRQSGAFLSSDKHGTTVLMEAAFYGQHEMVKYLLKHRDNLKLDPNTFDRKGRNALFYCAEAGNIEIFQMLLSHGVALHPALDGSTVLMTAALKSSHRMVEYFYENAAQLGLNMNAKDNRGRNCLFYAVSSGDMNLFKKLIRFGVNIENTRSGLNILLQAAARGDQSFCQYILDDPDDLKLDIQSRDQDGWNALFFAIASGKLNLFKLLHDYGVQTDPANDGRTLLMQAASRGNFELIRHILNNQVVYQSELNAQDNSGRTALYFSLQSENYQETFKFLLDRGLVINRTVNNSNILMETAKDTKNIGVLKMIFSMSERLGLNLEDVDEQGRNVLFYAAQNSDVKVLQYLLSLGTPVTDDANGRTILMTAAENGFSDLVELLINRQREIFLDIESKDADGRNALFYTISQGHFECFRLLIEAGISCAPDNSGVTILMLLAGYNHKNFLEFVMTASQVLEIDIQARDSEGDAAIHYALKNKQYENLLLLIQQGAKLIATGHGDSVISQCVDTGNFWVVEALATNGIDLTEDLNLKDVNGIPYFHLLLNSGIDDALMIALIELYYNEEKDLDASGVTMAMKLIDKENLVLRHLVEKVRVNLDKKDFDGRNLLHHCSFANNLDNVKYLLAFGAHFDEDNDGRIALMACARGCHTNVSCLKHLLNYHFRGESKKRVDRKGRNALHYGVRSGNVECAKLLLEHGLEIEAKDNHGMTPLLMAAEANHPDIVHHLAARGAEVNVRNNQSQNALHLVFENSGSFAMTKVLIDLNCDVNAKDDSDRTPLMLAARKDNLRPIKFLLEKGADATLLDKNGQQAIDYCPEDHHIIRVLLTKHRDSKPVAMHEVIDTSLLTSHLLLQIESGSGQTKTENETQSETFRARVVENLEKVVSGVVKRNPQSFDNLCKSLKERKLDYEKPGQEFYV